MEKLKLPVTGLIGAGFGLTTSEFLAEFVARATGQVKWVKFGIKGLIKGLFGTLLFLVSTRLPGAWGLGMEIASYGTFGSVIPDAFFQLYPGGVIGVAETAAVAVRTMAIGAEAVREEMERREEVVPPTEITVK